MNKEHLTHRYRFRAECWPDVEQLLSIIAGKMSKMTVIIERPFPDVEVTLDCPLSLEELRAAMHQVEDGHVMVETVAESEVYTGERKCDL